MVLTSPLLSQRMPLFMRSSLQLVSQSHTLRCDAKQAEQRFREFDNLIKSVDYFYLGDVLPRAFIKGAQPHYLETLDPDGIPVISTLAIQDLTIQTKLCRYISQEEFDATEEARKPKGDDVLVTLDGGTSIGKPALFELDDDYAIDSHIAILRPVGFSPHALVYLLYSPLGQVQFQRAESGASGQTGVTEEDIRRFRFPIIGSATLNNLVRELNRRKVEASRAMAEVRQREADAWQEFNEAIIAGSRK